MVRAHRVLDALVFSAKIISSPCDQRLFERVIVDAFPLGVCGELAGVDVPMDYVARLLLWDEYVRSVGDVRWPRFGTTYVVEELTPEHERFVQEHSERVVRVRLRSGGVTPPGQAASGRLSYWLIVHSGPSDEVRELVSYANDLKIIENSTA